MMNDDRNGSPVDDDAGDGDDVDSSPSSDRVEGSPSAASSTWSPWAVLQLPGPWRELDATGRAVALLWILVGVAGLTALVGFGIAAVRRVPYPFELEWMEGGIVDHVRVVLAGEPLYRRPSLEFTPYIYTPLYYYACALPAALLGPSFAVVRVVSAGSILVSSAIVHSWVRRETQDALAGIVAAGLLAATFNLTGCWFDIARPDSLALALLLGGLWVARFGERQWHGVAAALLLVLSIMTKQTMLIPALAGVAYALLADRRRGAVCAGAFGVLLGATVWIMNAISDGWFFYYAVTVPGQHLMLWDRWRIMLLRFYLHPVPVMLLWTILALATAAVRRHGRAVWVFYSLLVVLAAGSAYGGVLHKDGYVNVFMPAYAALAITTGIGLGWLRRQAAAGKVAPGLCALAGLSLLLQFGALSYDPYSAVPHQRDVAAGQLMLDKLAEAPRPMLMMGTGFYGHQAGHPEIHAHAMALADVFKTGDNPVAKSLEQEVLAAIRQRRFGSIVLGQGDGLMGHGIVREVKRHYRLKSRLFEGKLKEATRPRRGFLARPDELWVVRAKGPTRRPPRKERRSR